MQDSGLKQRETNETFHGDIRHPLADLTTLTVLSASARSRKYLRTWGVLVYVPCIETFLQAGERAVPYETLDLVYRPPR